MHGRLQLFTSKFAVASDRTNTKLALINTFKCIENSQNATTLKTAGSGSCARTRCPRMITKIQRISIQKFKELQRVLPVLLIGPLCGDVPNYLLSKCYGQTKMKTKSKVLKILKESLSALRGTRGSRLEGGHIQKYNFLKRDVFDTHEGQRRPGCLSFARPLPRTRGLKI